ncbi:MAG: hypothetical protein GX367_03245 [Bacteroidales bacterium]|jgi:hypothetical protein|nr:hypothetical protein [Bacteroidales bacterium]
MGSIIEVLLNLTEYFNNITSKLDSIDFVNSSFTQLVGNVRFLIGDVPWSMLMLVVYVSMVMALIRVIKGIISFVTDFIPFI